MKHTFKVMVSAAAALACFSFAGCTVSLGADGRDGQDVSIYDIWETTNQYRAEEGLEELTFLEFISEYLNYDSTELQEITSLQTTINRSLLSAVCVEASFDYPYYAGYGGSGVIIDVDKEEGDMYVVTNCHVVYSSSVTENSGISEDVYVYLYGQYSSDYAIPAEVIGASVSYDIAVLKVEDSDIVKSSDAVAAEWSQEDNVYVGEAVYAIGNAYLDGLSATTGIISVDSEYISLDMSDNGYYSDSRTYRVIRTDVPIYSGNSGGGLFDSDGRLVGIVNSKLLAVSEEDEEFADNVSYALPSSSVRRAVQNMIDAYEDSTSSSFTLGLDKAFLGVTVQVLSSSAYLNNNTNLVEIEERVQITDIASGALADGVLSVGDILTAVKIVGPDNEVRENLSVTRLYNVSEALLSARVGDTIYITVTRSGEEKTFTFSSITSSAMQHYD